MAFLAFVVMVASLLTVGFVGFEWIATTSTSRAYSHHTPLPRSEAVIQKRKDYLASAAAMKSLANSDPLAAAGDTRSQNDTKQEAQAEARTQETAEATPQDDTLQRAPTVRRNKARLARRPRNEITQADLGAGNPTFDPSFFGRWR